MHGADEDLQPGRDPDGGGFGAGSPRSLSCSGITGIMSGVVRRYGINEEYVRGWEIVFDIKEYFEKKAGCSVYDLLPDIGRTTLLNPKPWKPGNQNRCKYF